MEGSRSDEMKYFSLSFFSSPFSFFSWLHSGDVLPWLMYCTVLYYTHTWEGACTRAVHGDFSRFICFTSLL